MAIIATIAINPATSSEAMPATLDLPDDTTSTVGVLDEIITVFGLRC